MSVVKPAQVATIVRDAGGRVVGRTKLQKIAYLLEVAGYGDGFRFAYKYYGPFSEDVATSASTAALLGHIQEVEQKASWGGSYSIYTAEGVNEESSPAGRVALTRQASQVDSVVLELAATAIFLKKDDYEDPWEETARRKPEKLDNERLGQARELLTKLREIDVPAPLPEL